MDVRRFFINEIIFLDMSFLCLPNDAATYESIEDAITVGDIAKIFLEIWNDWQIELIFMAFAYILG